MMSDRGDDLKGLRVCTWSADLYLIAGGYGVCGVLGDAAYCEAQCRVMPGDGYVTSDFADCYDKAWEAVVDSDLSCTAAGADLDVQGCGMVDLLLAMGSLGLRICRGVQT